MAIQFQVNRSEADPFNNPEWRKRQVKKVTRELAVVDQVAKRDRKVAKLTAEIKEIAAAPLKRGRPSTGGVKITIRLNPETIAAFRAHGPGWQALVSDILDAAAPKP